MVFTRENIIDHEVVTINDLKDRIYDNIEISEEEAIAVKNFDKYRLNKLNNAVSKTEFNALYVLIRSEANILNFKEFL